MSICCDCALKFPVGNSLNMQVFLLGALAKLGATVVTYPLLVVKVDIVAVVYFVISLDSENDALHFLLLLFTHFFHKAVQCTI